MKNNDESKKSRGRRVRQIREELGLTQFQFEEALKLKSDGKYISRIENGGDFSRSLAAKMSAIAKPAAPVEWIVGETSYRNKADEARFKLNEAERKEASYQASVIILEDAAKRMGLTLTTFIDPHIENKSILAYCDTVTDSAKARYIAFSLHQSDDELDQVLECASLFKIQKRLSRYAEFLISEAIEEGSGIDGEQ